MISIIHQQLINFFSSLATFCHVLFNVLFFLAAKGFNQIQKHSKNVLK